MLVRERFIHKLIELTEDDELAWKPVEGRYTKDDSYVTSYMGAEYELKVRPENSQSLVITYDDDSWSLGGVTQLVKAVLYKEHAPWEIQEHIREVLNGVERSNEDVQ